MTRIHKVVLRINSVEFIHSKSVATEFFPPEKFFSFLSLHASIYHIGLFSLCIEKFAWTKSLKLNSMICLLPDTICANEHKFPSLWLLELKVRTFTRNVVRTTDIILNSFGLKEMLKGIGEAVTSIFLSIFKVNQEMVNLLY